MRSQALLRHIREYPKSLDVGIWKNIKSATQIVTWITSRLLQSYPCDGTKSESPEKIRCLSIKNVQIAVSKEIDYMRAFIACLSGAGVVKVMPVNIFSRTPTTNLQ